MLGGKRSLFHVDILLIFTFFLLGVQVISWTVNLIVVLIIKWTIWDIVWDFTHTLGVHWHRFMGFLCHSEYFAHLRWSWCRTINSSDASLLNDSILFSQFFEIWVLQRLSSRHSMVMVVYQKFLDDFPSFLVLWNHFYEPSTFLLGKVEFHVTCNFLKLI